MTVPAHLARFIDSNTAARVLLLCRSKGITSQARIGVYTRAVKQAVITRARREDLSVTQVDAHLNAQLEMLLLALNRPPPPAIPAHALLAVERMRADEAARQASAKPKRRRARRSPAAAPLDSKSMEEKLEDDRKPVRNLLQEDCVRLGLLQPDRATQLSRTMAGRAREEAEAVLMVELRNNLHAHIRDYMRKHKGGPWDDPKSQEEVRLDINTTNSVHAVVVLTRQLLSERNSWEKTRKKGFLSALLGRGINLSRGKKD